MKWDVAVGVLRLGEKITRPNWESEHFWVLSEDGFERILCHDGTHARVHAKQLEADDWYIWRSQITIEDISRRRRMFIENNFEKPNVIKFGPFSRNVFKTFEILGMKVMVDPSLSADSFIICHEKSKEKTLSDKIYLQAIGSERLPDSVPVNETRKSIKKLKKIIKEDCGSLVGENFDGSHFADWEEIDKIIKDVFGDALC
ncbi:MAG TPA: hypothetical protein VMX17_06290 [Candidatus Glassbacteria bacterium]|nr:hypothetical protein [Candidatus Glassbacteria bacterium]